jgi:uncharacterized protein YbbC (DUF1343 family)
MSMFQTGFKYSAFLLFLFFEISAFSQIIPAAELTTEYFPKLAGKKIALVANQTSMVGSTNLVDTLMHSGICVKKIFCPEHGFRGIADAGEVINSSTDKVTGLPVISLYGKNKKPTLSDLQGIDIVVFDIQDVGVRFYTYISTLHYVMEACAENNIPLLILDRPNPNSHYIDGPVLKPKYRSFVGMHTVPLVYGMTIGEYAKMINGEGWLAKGEKCDLQCIPCANYTHHSKYRLPVKPSPNLPNMQSIFLYPSLGLFEGTCISVGRGTDFPFQVIGCPGIDSTLYSFTPKSIPGAKNPFYENKKCFGFDLRNTNDSVFTLTYIINMYKLFPQKAAFFNPFFQKLAGNDELILQIKGGMSEEDIRNSWKVDLDKFKEIRKKYLIYPE